jgi:hypothetical protein
MLRQVAVNGAVKLPTSVDAHAGAVPAGCRNGSGLAGDEARLRAAARCCNDW